MAVGSGGDEPEAAGKRREGCEIRDQRVAQRDSGERCEGRDCAREREGVQREGGIERDGSAERFRGREIERDTGCLKLV